MAEDLPALLRISLGAMGVALLAVAVCRLRWMTADTTLARVRWATVAQVAAGALLVLTATARPDWFGFAALAGPAAALSWAMATSHAWRGSQPASVAKRKPARVMEWRPGPPREADTVILGEDRRRG